VKYKVRWKGYGSKSDTWEPESNLSCQELIRNYEKTIDPSKQKNRSKKSADSSSKDTNESQPETTNAGMEADLVPDQADMPRTRSRRRIAPQLVGDDTLSDNKKEEVSFSKNTRSKKNMDSATSARTRSKASKTTQEEDESQNNKDASNKPTQGSRKRKRSVVESDNKEAEEENQELEPLPKRRRNKPVIDPKPKTSDQNEVIDNGQLTPDKMAKMNNFDFKSFTQAFCDVYNRSPSQRLNTFWKNYSTRIK